MRHGLHRARPTRRLRILALGVAAAVGAVPLVTAFTSAVGFDLVVADAPPADPAAAMTAGPPARPGPLRSPATPSRASRDDAAGRPPARPRAATSPPVAAPSPPAAPSLVVAPFPSAAPRVPPPARTAPSLTVPSSPWAPMGTSPPSSAPAAADPVSGRVVELTNLQRARAGCPDLTADARLAAAAQDHSADMAARGYFSHTSQDGRTPWDRVGATGYRFAAAAENIAAGQRTADDVVAAWMASPGHRANILNCSLRQIGVGHATGSAGTYGTYWTQDFATPR